MNPWVIVGFLVVLIGSNLYSFSAGTDVGENREKVASQAAFDNINKMLARKKAEATAKYIAKQNENIALMAERDALKTKLEQQRQANEKENRDLRDRYASFKLRFTVPGDGGDRGGSGRAEGPPGNPPGAAAPERVVELPDEIAENLRQLAFDADRLRTHYATCYGYAQQVR